MSSELLQHEAEVRARLESHAFGRIEARCSCGAWAVVTYEAIEGLKPRSWKRRTNWAVGISCDITGEPAHGCPAIVLVWKRLRR